MAYPAGVITRPVTFGPAFELEDGDVAGMQVTFKATRPGVLWMETGQPAVSTQIVRTADDGVEQVVYLPVTDQDGWGDGDGNLIVPGADGHVFLYIVTVIFTQNGRTIPGAQPRSKVVPIPQGDLTPLDLDKLIPLTTPGGTVVSVPDIWSEQIAAAEAAAVAAAESMIDSDTFMASKADDPTSEFAASLSAKILTGIESDTTKANAADVLSKAQALAKSYLGTVPPALGWTADTLSPTLYAGSPVGSAGITPQALFDRYSAARSNPGKTFYVSTGGNDTNDGLTVGTAFRGLSKAITAANAGGLPTLIYVAAGVFERNRSFGTTAIPAVDIALVATGGHVSTGTFDLLTIATPDGTLTSTYTAAVANCERVVDTANLNRYGNYAELTKVATAAQVDKIPGTWALVSGTIYIHRADEKPITTANTRVFRSQTFTFLVQDPLNVYVEGFDFEGGSDSGVVRFDMRAAGPASADKAVVLNSSSFKYGGGAVGLATVGLAVSSWQGLVAAFNCQADANATDGFNFHNGQGVPRPMSLTVNCSGNDNGRNGAASCQGLTYHETCVGIDIAGVYEGNRGGNIRNIDSSKVYLLGTTVRVDKGDGIAMPPTGIRLDNSAEAWCERTVIEQPRGQYAYATGGGAAKMHRRDCQPVPQPDSGPGVFDTY